MKSTIIILGLVALSFTNANAATEFQSYDLDQQESASVFVEDNSITTDGSADIAVFNPAVVQTAYVKTIEERVAEDQLITESKEAEYQPLSLGYTLEDRIAEGNQIIESNISNETFPLDFEKINRNVKTIINNNNAIKVTELKL